MEFCFPGLSPQSLRVEALGFIVEVGLSTAAMVEKVSKYNVTQRLSSAQQYLLWAICSVSMFVFCLLPGVCNSLFICHFCD